MPYTTTVHYFSSPTPHSCAYELGSTESENALVFIGGLGDGPHTIPYVQTIASHLESQAGLSYSVFEIRMASSFAGFGFSSLDNDVDEIAGLVDYLRSLGRGRIVLLGHSTGCQDCMRYSSKAQKSSPVDGFILQGPVSDREAMAMEMTGDALRSAMAMAKQMIKDGRKDEVMPRALVLPSFTTPITAYRFDSLAAEGGDDDYFSSDLPPDRIADIWCGFDKPVLILHSAEDQHVPEPVDIAACSRQWASSCRPGVVSQLSGAIPGANHRVEKKEAQEWMADRVATFLEMHLRNLSGVSTA